MGHTPDEPEPDAYSQHAVSPFWQGPEEPSQHFVQNGGCDGDGVRLLEDVYPGDTDDDAVVEFDGN